MIPLPTVTSPSLHPAVLLAAFAPPLSTTDQTFAYEHHRPKPKLPKKELTAEQLTTFNSWWNDGLNYDDLHEHPDQELVAHFAEVCAANHAIHAWNTEVKESLELAWRWEWAKRLLAAMPAAFKGPPTWLGIDWVEGYDPTKPPPVSDGADAIKAERQRVLQVEGYTMHGDDQYEHGELILAAISYARVTQETAASGRLPPPEWPWRSEMWKPGDLGNIAARKRCLEKAGQFLAAEWDRLARLQANMEAST